MKLFRPRTVSLSTQGRTMKNNGAQLEKTIDAMLAKMPVEPRADFADRVLAAEKKSDAKISAMLREMPIEPSENFAENVIKKYPFPDAPTARRHFFPLHFTEVAIVGTFAAMLAIAAVPALFFQHGNAAAKSAVLATKVAAALANDPELYALAQAEDADAISLDELISASEILTAVDPATIEILASNE